MPAEPLPISTINRQVGQLFAHVSEALAGATHALLSMESTLAQGIVEADRVIDDLTQFVDALVWTRIDSEELDSNELGQLVNVLLILPELERSADLAEHIAQRAVGNLGAQMSPLSRGCVQRMSEVAIEMWRDAAQAYVDGSSQGIALDVADEEIDILRDRLTEDLSSMPTVVATEVALIGRFYERLGDHAVNLARRMERLRHPEED